MPYANIYVIADNRNIMIVEAVAYGHAMSYRTIFTDHRIGI